MTTSKVWLGIVLGSIALAACAATNRKGDDDDDDDAGEEGGQQGGGMQAPEGPACLASSIRAEIGVHAVQDVDIVFAVDNSESMADEQESLARELPRMLAILTSGDVDSDGVGDFPPARSLHLAVVSTDLGLPGVTGVEGCEGLGDDGRFNDTVGAAAPGCSTTTFDPPFLIYSRDAGDDPISVGTDLSCLTTVGLDGCTIEQPLESLLKAVWPASSTDVTFLAQNGTTAGGNAGPGSPNGDFFRDAPPDGPSVVALVVVTDEEDCSVRDTGFLAPDASPNGIGTRCYFENQRGADTDIFAVDRYIQTFKALRAGNEDFVIFAGIVGVPPELTDANVVRQFDFSQPNEANAFFDGLLAAPAMQETIDSRGTPDDQSDDRLIPSCNRGEGQLAFPPRRIVQVAKGFGGNGIIQSICQDNFAPAIDSVIEAISRKLGVPCVPKPFVRSSDGLIDCRVTWELGSDTGDVEQLAVLESREAPNGDGWYYDDFSLDTQLGCMGLEKQRIVFTEGAGLPQGATALLSCFQAQYHLEVDRSDIRADVQQPKVGDRCDQVMLRNRDVTGDEACVQLTNTGEDRRMFCHDSTKTCVLGCNEDADCPELWVCDDGAETVQAAGGRAMCSPGTCSVGPGATSDEVVGDPCLPLFVPPDGFDDSEGYIEGNHPYCEGGACIVYHLSGDPREDCFARNAPGLDGFPPVLCSSPNEVEARVYCSCRCDAPEGFAECECPDGFSCVDVLDNAPEEIAGRYCVRNGSVAR